MALNVAVTVTGIPTPEQRRMAHFLVDEENKRRAQLEPPGTPLAKTPDATFLTSLETVLRQDLIDTVVAKTGQSGTINRALEVIPEDKKADIAVAIIDRINGGESIDSIITDLQS